MPTGSPVDGFRLTYDRHGSPTAGRPTVVLLHGWPGDRTDLDAVAARLAGDHDVLVPDLRGFGESDKHHEDPATAYGPDAQARSVAGLADELGLTDLVVAGYDVGSRVAQQLGRDRGDLTRAIVVAPPAPGVGRRVLAEGPMREFWYQAFHQLDLAEELVDGSTTAARAYVKHFWSHWSGPDFTPDDARLDHLASVYGPAGAFVASVGWYRAGGGMVARSLAEQAPDPADRLAVPTTFVWPEHDPLFPREWSDRLDEFFSDVTVIPVDGVGHFVPVEAPEAFTAAVAHVADLHSTAGGSR
ncbi:pimeloyl-ACP methyl ester carboxylesterase [Pseudonocardia sediminis]|uniref:Pimeloyl-ACP methyl ester carboxylesterase n=1 Tax=Pseudonocardia sediminis TaxID=1397368 RepID=A0A4Q7UYJ3_PSEST|nr:alpha/beta hydrolase [Pseudonocardia sediminis]RZT86051.1 pimeloyl-ACP methyl ester carboxylesterase [Pseudonocardia sediminis]